jgi:hypothetical protein
MGQRLVIEIKEGDTVLANAYYHWSGYTETSLNLLNEVMNKGILNNIPIKFSKGDEQLYAIKLLETTGAKILEEDFKIATLKFPMNEFETSKNKTDGLIAFSEKNINKNMDSAEAIISIDLKSRTIDIGGIYNYENLDELQEMANEDEEDLNIAIIDFNTTEISFEDFKNRFEDIKKLIENHEYIKSKEDEDIISFIM